MLVSRTLEQWIGHFGSLLRSTRSITIFLLPVTFGKQGTNRLKTFGQLALILGGQSDDLPGWVTEAIEMDR